MKITINGHERELQVETVAELVASLELKGDRVAVEQNLDIVPRSKWEATPVREGDRFEVVHFVGGGSF
jgi:thiamine biosynthesis protein ThiS